jgi:hypothetical protein
MNGERQYETDDLQLEPRCRYGVNLLGHQRPDLTEARLDALAHQLLDVLDERGERLLGVLVA